MGLIYKGQLDQIHIHVWQIAEPETWLWKNANLSTAEAAYLATIRHPRRRLESLAARCAREGLPSYPFTSLSHSYPWAAAASALFPIGLDLERKRPFPTHVLDYFSQEAERQSLSKHNLTEWHIWLAKEVAYKLLCANFRPISFKREFFFDGQVLTFQRGAILRKIRVAFLEQADWLLAVGSFL